MDDTENLLWKMCTGGVFNDHWKGIFMDFPLVPFCVAIENKMLHGQDFLALPLAGGCHMTCPSQ